MSRREKARLAQFKMRYPEFCKGKCEKSLLVYLKFIEAVRKEIKAQARHIRLMMDFSIAVGERLENELILGATCAEEK